MKRSNRSYLNARLLFIACSVLFPSIASAAQCKIKVYYSDFPFKPKIVGSEHFVIHLNSTQITNRKHMRKIRNLGDRDVQISYWDISGNHNKIIRKGATRSVSGDLKRTKCTNKVNGKLFPAPRRSQPRRRSDLSIRTLDIQYINGAIKVKTRLDNSGPRTPRSFKTTASLYHGSKLLQSKKTKTISLSANGTFLWEPTFRGSSVNRANKVKIKIDSQNVIQETNEANNTAQRRFTPTSTAELSLRTLTVANKSKRRLRTSPSLYRYSVKVKTRMDNKGHRRANLFQTYVKLQCKSNSNSTFRTYKMKTITKSLSAGGTYLWQPVLTFSHRRNLHSCRINAKIDSTNRIRENSEHDNLARRPFRF